MFTYEMSNRLLSTVERHKVCFTSSSRAARHSWLSQRGYAFCLLPLNMREQTHGPYRIAVPSRHLHILALAVALLRNA